MMFDANLNFQAKYFYFFFLVSLVNCFSQHKNWICLQFQKEKKKLKLDFLTNFFSKA